MWTIPVILHSVDMDVPHSAEDRTNLPSTRRVGLTFSVIGQLTSISASSSLSVGIEAKAPDLLPHEG